MVSAFLQWLIASISTLGYLGILVLMAIESSVLPLPSELVMPPAGYLAAKGSMNPYLAVAAGAAGSILGALLNYGLAAWVGEPVLRRYGRLVLISNRSLDRAEAFFNRHGEIGTLTGRLVPVVRHLISIPAGLARMPLGRFAAFTGIGAAVWCGILTYIGWILGRHEQALEETVIHAYTRQAVLYLLPILAAGLGLYTLWYRRRRRTPE